MGYFSSAIRNTCFISFQIRVFVFVCNFDSVLKIYKVNLNSVGFIYVKKKKCDNVIKSAGNTQLFGQ